MLTGEGETSKELGDIDKVTCDEIEIGTEGLTEGTGVGNGMRRLSELEMKNTNDDVGSEKLGDMD